jgi:pimeloyl-ACP methyl ester carboxylesterase
MSTVGRRGPRVVFVHGAFVRDGSWWWAPVADRLARRGTDSVAVALPSCGETGVAPTGEGPTLTDDVAAVRTILDDDVPTILVAHSYGGMVAAAAAGHRAVTHLVCITSFLPLPGESLADIGRSSADPVPVVPLPGGALAVRATDRSRFIQRFLHDVVDPELVDGALERLTTQSAAVFSTPASEAGWRGKPTTCLVCADDRSTDPELQRRHAQRATRTIELPAGHHPFLSQPDLVTQHLLTIATEP